MRVPFIAGWFVYVYFMENPNLKWKVVAPVRGRVGDDITQCQDDEGSVRNCSNLYIFIFLK